MKKGFTLIELSIVLVIVGLLIGGILVAQSMISTARVQGYVRKLQQYDIAITNFKTKYNQTPGDSSYFTPAGNNNGYIGDYAGYCGGGYYNDERFTVWGHLSQAGMIEGNYSSWSPVFCGGTQADSSDELAGVVLPVFAEDKVFRTWLTAPDTSKIPIDYTLSSSDHLRKYHSYLAAGDAIPLDVKMDDGVTNTGRFTASYISGTDCATYAATHSYTSSLCYLYYNPDQ